MELTMRSLVSSRNCRQPTKTNKHPGWARKQTNKASASAQLQIRRRLAAGHGSEAGIQPDPEVNHWLHVV